MKNLFKVLSISFLFLISCESQENDWINLFYSESLDGWEIKIAGYELNNNYKNTFGIGNGTIKVAYDLYDSFDKEFGHIFYTKRKFKNYQVTYVKITRYKISK